MTWLTRLLIVAGALGVAAAACGGPIRVPGGKEMGEECFDDEECDDPGTCLNGVCSGYACDNGSCENELVCTRVNDQDSCVLPCAGDRDCRARQVCTQVARSSGNPDDVVTVCL